MQIDKSKFFSMNAVEVVTLGLLILSAGGGLAELHFHQKETQAALGEARSTAIQLDKKTTEFRDAVNSFIARQDAEAARQRQIDQDCPRHRHGKNGQMFFCGQQPGETFAATPSPDPQK